MFVLWLNSCVSDVGTVVTLLHYTLNMMTSSNGNKFSALLAISAGNSSVSGEFPAQRPVTRSFDVFFDLHPNKRLSKQWWGWWFETISCPLWRHRNEREFIYSIFSPNSGMRHWHFDDPINFPWWRHQMETFRVTGHFPPHKGGALVLSLICFGTNGWANNRDAGDLIRHCAHYDATVMIWVKSVNSVEIHNLIGV